jgi:enamine deaminase RidA (YjgF/YER057c/UK114 family)
MNMTEIERKLKQLGYDLPKVPMDMKFWARCSRVGKLVFMGTTGPWPILNKTVDGKLRGVIGKDVTVEEAKHTCRLAALSILSGLKNEFGDLDKIDRIVKLEVYLSGMGGSPDPYVEVADAASELFIQLYGDNGRATRTMTPNISDYIAEIDIVASLKD